MTANRSAELADENATPTVSWILCAHVLNDHLKLSIESCLAQGFPDFEIVFVANGPHASTIGEAVQLWFGGDRRVRIFTTSVRQLPFSLSLGLHHARGSLIARMDSDDISQPDRLQRQVTFMRDHPDVAVLGTHYEIVDNDGKILSAVFGPLTDRSIRRALLTGNPLCHPTVMFRKHWVLDVGGYLGGLYAEDYDLWTRLALNRQIQFANLPHVCLSYRVTGVGNARRSRWAYASMAASQFRNLLLGAGLQWGIAVVLSIFKVIFRSSRIRGALH